MLFNLVDSVGIIVV